MAFDILEIITTHSLKTKPIEGTPSAQQVAEEIQLASDTGEAEAAAVAGQSSVMDILRNTIDSKATDLATTVSTVTEKEKISITASLEKDIAAETAAATVYEKNKDNLSAFDTNIAAAQEDIEFANEQKDVIQLRMRGKKLNAEGDEVDMTVFEKVGSYLQHNMLSFDAEDVASLDQQIVTLQNQKRSAEMGMAQTLKNITDNAEFDADYVETKKLALTAMGMLALDKATLAERENLFNITQERYNIQKDKMLEITTAAQMFDETTKPRMMMQLMGLEMEAERLRISNKADSFTEKIFDAYKTTFTAALERQGTNTDTKEWDAVIVQYAGAAARGDWNGVIAVQKRFPHLLSEISTLPDELGTEAFTNLGSEAWDSFANSDDPKLKAMSTTLNTTFEQTKIEIKDNEDVVNEISTQLLNQGFKAGSDEFIKEFEKVVTTRSEIAAATELKLISSNSIDYLRRQGLLSPVAKVSLGNFYTAQMEDNKNIDPEEISMATSVSSHLDKNIKMFTDSPNQWLDSFFLDRFRDVDLLLNSSNDDVNSWAAGISTTFAELNQSNIQNNKDNILITPTEGNKWILQGDMKIGKINLRGRNLADPATWRYIINLRKSLRSGGKLPAPTSAPTP